MNLFGPGDKVSRAAEVVEAGGRLSADGPLFGDGNDAPFGVRLGK